jgi:hypothetical protein
MMDNRKFQATWGRYPQLPWTPKSDPNFKISKVGVAGRSLALASCQIAETSFALKTNPVLLSSPGPGPVPAHLECRVV